MMTTGYTVMEAILAERFKHFRKGTKEVLNVTKNQ